jgi:acetyl esterase/lipase
MRVLAFGLFMTTIACAQPSPELLWPEGAPLAQGQEDRDRPTLTTYLPEPGKRNGASVVVCPGGGYQNLAMDHEGKQIAEFLNRNGIAAFVLKYRLGPRYRHPAPLLDAQRAIRMVRTRATSLGLAPGRIGIWGFSAGGHLASTAGTHFDAGKEGATDPIDRASSRPDFLVLAYPVMTFTDEAYVHKGSRRNLLGEAPDPELAKSLSNETRVTAQTPPTFLFHTDADTGVPPENSVLFYLALRKHGIPAEMHIYEKGKHGVGLAPQDPILSSWGPRLLDWFRTRGLLESQKP